MAKAAFETLEIYQLSEQLADLIWDVAVAWDAFAKDTVGRQIVRAADSIGANIAEGFGRGTPLDHKRFLRIARGSLNETTHLLRRAFRRKLLTQAQIAEVRKLLDILGPKLNAFLNSVGRRNAPPPKRLRKHQRPTTNHNPQTTNKD